MKIVVVVRTRDEAMNIGRFCIAYRECADLILVADGGSEDHTIAIAKCFKNVKVRNFTERLEFPGGLWRNPHGKHMNFMFNWAVEEGADWIIFDDCDAVPTAALQKNLREIFENATYPTIWLYRLYIYGKDKYFPRMNDPGKSIYAWKPETGIMASEEKMFFCYLNNVPALTSPHRVVLEPPLCSLHYFCPTDEIVRAKMDFYKSIGECPAAARHPTEYGGPLADLPEWAHE